MNNFKISWGSAGKLPSREEVREASYEMMAENAIAEWTAGNYARALVWAGKGNMDIEEVDVHLKAGKVYLSISHDPTGGNSPRPVVSTVRLGGSPAAEALALRIVEQCRPPG